ncbi:glycosyltransferase family 2 protein [Kaistella sp.]|uniref:glycosyltransferase family 2 protein n=1 Tax=Kaistella sp. TaxID=2782235 RepID=UPI002F93BAB1
MNKLAIIIPYYKISFFTETLQSLEQQTCKDFILFIGNDASRENPEILIKETLKTTEFTYKEYTENFGSQNLVKQWERCIQDCQITDWFHILGDDDIISDNFVAEFYKNLPEIDQSKSNVIKFSQRWIDENGQPFKEYSVQPKVLTALENWKEKYINGQRSSLSEHIFRKSAYEKVKFSRFPLAWGTDDLAVFEISGTAPVYFISDAKVEVRISSHSISGSEELYLEKQRHAIAFETYFINKYHQQLPKEYILDKISQQINFAFHHRFSDLKLNLVKYYWHLGEFKKLAKLPFTYFNLILKRL